MIGQLQDSLDTAEDEFAELLALLMHLSDKESIESGLDSVSQFSRDHPYKFSGRSRVVSFEDEKQTITDQSFPNLLERANELYQDVSIEEDKIHDRILELIAEDLQEAISDN